MTSLAIFNCHESACVSFHLSFHFFTCVPLVFTCVHLCSLVFTCVHLCSLVFTCVHLCSLVFTFVLLVFTCVSFVFHLCSAYVHLCSTCVHLCSLVFTCVQLCSFVFLLVWCFRLDHAARLPCSKSKVSHRCTLHTLHKHYMHVSMCL